MAKPKCPSTWCFGNAVSRPPESSYWSSPMIRSSDHIAIIGQPRPTRRTFVVPGGCSGYEYSLEFASAPQQGDHVVRHGEVDVYVDADSVAQLEGTVLECPFHGGKLDVRDGSPQRPPIRRPAATYPVRRVEGGFDIDLGA